MSSASAASSAHQQLNENLAELKAQLAAASPLIAARLKDQSKEQAARQLHNELVVPVTTFIKDSQEVASQGCAVNGLTIILDHIKDTNTCALIISQMAADADLLASLAQMLQSTDFQASYRALVLIRSIIKHTQDTPQSNLIISAVLAQQMAPALVGILQLGAPCAAQAAAEVLASLVSAPETSIRVQRASRAGLASAVAAGAIPALLKLLQAHETAAETGAAAPTLLELLQAHETADASPAVAAALRVLTACATAGGDTRAQLLSASGIPHLLQQLQSVSTSDQLASLRGLTLLCSSEEHTVLRSLLLDHGGTAALLAVITHRQDRQVMTLASAIIMHIATTDPQQFHKAGACEAAEAISFFRYPRVWAQMQTARLHLATTPKEPQQTPSKALPGISYLQRAISLFAICCVLGSFWLAELLHTAKCIEEDALASRERMTFYVSLILKLSIDLWMPNWGLLWLLGRLLWLVLLLWLEQAFIMRAPHQHTPVVSVALGTLCFVTGVMWLAPLVFYS